MRRWKWKCCKIKFNIFPILTKLSVYVIRHKNEQEQKKWEIIEINSELIYLTFILDKFTVKFQVRKMR